MADAYQQAVFGLVKAGKLGWSSGAVGHLVKKSSDGQITRWPIGEASITPCPCEPLNRAIAVDSLQTVKFINLDGDGDGDMDDDDDPGRTDWKTKAVWTAAYINNLPDAAFLLIEDGGAKDSDGKTTPRSLRHFPYKNSSGEVDLPHLRNALARIPQSKLSADQKASALAKARRIAKANGIDTGDGGSSKGLSAELNQFIADRVDDGRDRASIIAQMARAAGLDVKTVEKMLAPDEVNNPGDDIIRPQDPHLRAFARVLGVEFDVLKSSVKRQHQRTIKGMFEEAIAEQRPTRWELESTYCLIIKRLANAALASNMAGIDFDLEGKIKEATTEYTGLLQTYALAQIQEWMQDGGDDDFYFKAILDAERRLKSLAATDLDSHSEFAVIALRDLAARFYGNHTARLKAGRVLSEKNRQRITSLISQANAVIADFQALLDESQPMASEAEKRAALTKYLMLQHQHRMAGL
jgi:hypothetical protein